MKPRRVDRKMLVSVMLSMARSSAKDVVRIGPSPGNVSGTATFYFRDRNGVRS